MQAKPKFLNKNLAIILIAFLLVISLSFTFTLSYFTDKKQSSSVIVFGKVAVGAQLVEKASSTIILTPQELVPGNTQAYKTLKITCASDSENFYIRVYGVLKVNSTKSNLITLNIAETSGTSYWSSYNNIANYDASNWKTGTDGKYYYNYSLKKAQSGDAIYYIPLQFNVSSEIGTDVINNSSANLQIIVEVIQEANNGYLGWTGYPSSWPLTH